MFLNNTYEYRTTGTLLCITSMISFTSGLDCPGRRPVQFCHQVGLSVILKKINIYKVSRVQIPVRFFFSFIEKNNFQDESWTGFELAMMKHTYQIYFDYMGN